ncbi:MAG: hypothetical protein DWQ49_04315 [Bacteroidetes bacterium]|nr:MAG: hypothetical protein DWQ49_04315 [Bacteroidota bacterium]
MKKILLGLLVLLFTSSVLADSWDATVTGVRSCKHPTTGATLIQIDFDKGSDNWSLVLADNDYSDITTVPQMTNKKGLNLIKLLQ